MTHMVLFIDESSKLLQHSLFPRPESILGDPYSELRETMLGDEMGRLISTSLVMTSASFEPFDRTKSLEYMH